MCKVCINCCGVLQCVAVCCNVLQCVAVVLHHICAWYALFVAVCCSVLQCVAVCCSVLQCVAVCCSVLCGASSYMCKVCIICCGVLQCVAACCRMLQCVAVCCCGASSYICMVRIYACVQIPDNVRLYMILLLGVASAAAWSENTLNYVVVRIQFLDNSREADNLRVYVKRSPGWHESIIYTFNYVVLRNQKNYSREDTARSEQIFVLDSNFRQYAEYVYNLCLLCNQISDNSREDDTRSALVGVCRGQTAEGSRVLCGGV